MPLAPPRLCTKPHCPGRVQGGVCSACGPRKRATDHNRPNFRDRGYSWEWTKYSLSFRKQNPLCVECLKRDLVTPATCVDHIVPHKGDYELMWDSENHQSLCDSCHGAKSAKEK